MKTTPGPWVWRGNQLYAPGESSTLLRDVTFWNTDPGDKSLIAAAPSLLAHVETVLFHLRRGDHKEPNCVPQMISALEGVVAKATE